MTAAVIERCPRTRPRLRLNASAVIGAGGLLALVIVAVFAPHIAPYDPNDQVLAETLRPPSSSHWLGTDALGRDVLSRLVFGTRVSALAGIEVLAVSLVLGLPLGMLAGYVGGWFDRIVSQVFDAMLTVPGVLLAITVVAALGPGLGTAMFAIGIAMAPRFYRLVRATTQIVRNETYIRASISIGCSRARIIAVHIFPNILPPLIVQTSFVLGAAIISEASLSFLGLGVRPPTASWGQMLSDAANRLDQGYLTWGPGLAITASVLAFASLGDWLRDAVGVQRRSS